MRYKHSKRRGQNIESARRTKPYKHTKRHGFLLGFVDFFTAGLFFLLYMPLGGL